MDIHNVRMLLKTQSIYNIPLRVTYYARVSSESDEQLNSLGNQISYYENLIKKNLCWTFVPGYIDEGLSGISTRKRENFNRMIDDAAEGKFDLVITKEISRFARNTLDSIQFTRKLLSHGVGVFFQNDNINTLDEDSELRLSIMSSIAQEELRKLSSRVKFGHQQAIKDKVVLGNSRIFGYQKDGGRLVVDEEQAPMVRELFALYATGEYSMKQIETIFWEKGYRNYNGNKIAHTTMSNMISNPKYKGYYVGNKVKVIDMFTKQQKFLPPEEWVMFKDESGEIVPALVSEELWDRANEVLKRRSDDVKSRQGICNHANLMTGKLYCSCCGTPYYRRDSKDRQGNKNSKWICSGKINNGADSCPSFAIYEEEIKPILFDVFRETEVNANALMAEYMELYRSLDQDNNLGKEIERQKGSLDIAQKKKSKLLEYNVTGQISDSEYLAMNKACAAEIKEIEAQILDLEQQMYSKEEFRKHMDAIHMTLEAARRDAQTGIITAEFVSRYIDKILVTPEGNDTLRLDIKIFTGESTKKYLQNLKVRAGQMSNVSDANEENLRDSKENAKDGRMGHTFKKMIEAYEQGLQ
jgi:DNA invertase Pin-like site-specific DNA recombinase